MCVDLSCVTRFCLSNATPRLFWARGERELKAEIRAAQRLLLEADSTKIHIDRTHVNEHANELVAPQIIHLFIGFSMK